MRFLTPLLYESKGSVYGLSPKQAGWGYFRRVIVWDKGVVHALLAYPDGYVYMDINTPSPSPEEQVYLKPVLSTQCPQFMCQYGRAVLLCGILP